GQREGHRSVHRRDREGVVRWSGRAGAFRPGDARADGGSVRARGPRRGRPARAGGPRQDREREGSEPVARGYARPQTMRWLRALSLSSQLLLLQVAIVAATVIIGATASYALVSSQIDDQYEQRALSIAYAVAATPDIVEAMTDVDPPK